MTTAIMAARRMRILSVLSLLPLTFVVLLRQLFRLPTLSTKDSSFRQTNHDRNGVCSLLPRDVHSASRWWTENFESIASSSQYDPNDATMASWTRSLLASVSPEMLQNGMKARPSTHSLHHISTRINKLIRNTSNSTENFTPLQILVVGGSVTRGRGCNVSPVNATGEANLHPTKCAWPSRLEHMINSLTKNNNLVQVYNVAVGATNLEFGIPILKYKLWPKELEQNGGPDVIIAAYATNEQASHITDTTTKKWRNEKREVVQRFIQAATTSIRLCDSKSNTTTKPPLVIFVDDYLGNRQGLIEREMSFKQVVNQVSEWYPNTMSISYADVIRPFIYADTSDIIFSPDWSPNDNKKEVKPRINVHFGMSGHVATAWSVLYGMIDVIMGYCDNQEFERQMKEKGEVGVFSAHVQDLVQNVPPPKLTSWLSMQNVSEVWQRNAIRRKERVREAKDNKCDDESPCEFAFLAGPESTVRNTTELSDYLQPYVIYNDGWEPVMNMDEDGYVSKLGLAAMKKKAKLSMHFPNIQRPISTMNVQRIKSYGKKWANSVARFTVKVEAPTGREFIHRYDLDGYHDSQTSVSYAFESAMKRARKGSNVTLSIDLVGGSTFKMIGLMLCSY